MTGAQKRMRLAMLGCGYAAQKHGKTLGGLRRHVRCYFASRDISKAKEITRRYDGAGSFGSYEEALDSDVDVIAVLLPPAHHLEWTLRSLRAGKDVIVEKPPFMRAADFDTVEQACADTGRRVFVAENYYYKPLLVRLRKIITSGLIGDVLFVHLNAIKSQPTGDWRDKAELAGPGALFEGGIHWINFAANLGLEIKNVRGTRPGGNDGIERSMLVTIEYEQGAVGTLAYSWEVPSPLRGIRISRIFGREGAITFESNGIFLALSGNKRRLGFPGFSDIQGYRGMFRDFIRAWRTGEEPEMNLAKARRDLTLVEQAYRTAGMTADDESATAGSSVRGAQ